MSKYIPAKEVSVKEGFDPIEIQVYVAHNFNSSEPFATASIVSSKYPTYVPEGDVVERYTFKINRPKMNEE